jgi:hypothetical protein
VLNPEIGIIYFLEFPQGGKNTRVLSRFCRLPLQPISGETTPQSDGLRPTGGHRYFWGTPYNDCQGVRYPKSVHLICPVLGVRFSFSLLP